MVVHCTHFNCLMWNTLAPARVGRADWPYSPCTGRRTPTTDDVPFPELRPIEGVQMMGVGSTATPEAQRWPSTPAVSGAKECSPCRGEADAEEGPAAARVDRRRSPAACAAGVRPAIRRSTSTIAAADKPPAFGWMEEGALS